MTDPRAGFIWDPDAGIRLLSEFIENELGLDASGWSLDRVSAVSADGLTIVGFDTNPNGTAESWILVIPEPSTALLVGSGLGRLAMAPRRDRVDERVLSISCSTAQRTREA